MHFPFDGISFIATCCFSDGAVFAQETMFSCRVAVAERKLPKRPSSEILGSPKKCRNPGTGSWEEDPRRYLKMSGGNICYLQILNDECVENTKVKFKFMKSVYLMFSPIIYTMGLSLIDQSVQACWKPAFQWLKWLNLSRIPYEEPAGDIWGCCSWILFNPFHRWMPAFPTTNPNHHFQ